MKNKYQITNWIVKLIIVLVSVLVINSIGWLLGKITLSSIAYLTLLSLIIVLFNIMIVIKLVHNQYEVNSYE
jgi:Na+/phosphate symporter